MDAVVIPLIVEASAVGEQGSVSLPLQRQSHSDSIDLLP
jgi:hypothetical protein